MKKVKAKAKRVISFMIATLMATLVVLNCTTMVVLAESASNYDMVGTQEALNSPVLNSGFTSDNWNKWEMVCWGVFLSNFCVPFVDTYQTAFSATGTGSNGSGYKALVFGGGSDTASTETIKGLADYAINQQTQAAPKTIYVSKSTVTGSKVEFNDLNVVLANDTTAVAEELADKATINDFLLAGYPSTFSYFGQGNMTELSGGLESGELPTFWILEEGVFIKVLDYTDAYDIQLPGLALARAYKSDFIKEAQENIKTWADSKAQLGLDTFGNIVVSDGYSQYILLPAAANQHLTADKSINLANSLIMNGYDQTIDSRDLRLKTAKVEDTIFNNGSMKGGRSILNQKISELSPGSVVLYFSGETINYQNSTGLSVVGEEPQVLRKLFDCSLDNQYPDQDTGTNNGGIGSNEYQFIMQPVGLSSDDFYKVSNIFNADDKAVGTGIKDLLFYANGFVNALSKSTSTRVLTTIKTPSGAKLPLFNDPTVITYTYTTGTEKGKENRAGAIRDWYNMMYQVYKSGIKTTHGDVTSDELKGVMDSTNTIKELNLGLISNKSGKIGNFLAAYYLSHNGLFKLKSENEQLAEVDVKSGKADFTKPNEILGKDVVETKYNTTFNIIRGGSAIDEPDYANCVLAYPISETMMNVGNVLGIREGTQFSVYSAYIYMTYLNWYGITTRAREDDNNGNSSIVRTVEDPSSYFDTRIFTEKSEILQTDINSIAKVKSEEDKQTELLEYNYLMLHPTEGRSYRAEMWDNLLTDFLYNSYQRMVYGSASSAYSQINSASSYGNSSGFLNIDTMHENFLISWLIDIYAVAVVWISGALIILIVLFGLITRKKITWFIVSTVVMINALLVVPSLGDIVPYIANNAVSNIFQDKMTYWAIAEGAYNESLSAEFKKNQSKVSRSSDSGLNNGEASSSEVIDGLKLVQDLSTLYTDRSIMVKQDISQKVMESLEGNYAEIQNMQTTRWLLPLVVQQFSATSEADLYNYVMEPLHNENASMRNLYYWYNPDENPDQDKMVANQNGESEYISDTDKGALEGYIDGYDDYVNISAQVSAQGSLIEYYSKSYEYHPTVMDMTHSIFYYVKESSAIPVSRKNVINQSRYDEESWNDYALEALGSSGSGFDPSGALTDKFDSIYNTYDRTSLYTMQQEFGYLWNTESPMTYMYCVVRDTFPSISNMSYVAGQLVGSFETYESTDEQGNVLKDNLGNPLTDERRVSFMYAPETEYVRDVLDLQEMFNNMLPYMYQMELTACGPVNGTTGKTGDSKIENGLYEGALKSWFYRSNWITKLMGNPDYNKSAKVKDKDGNVYEVPNMMLPDTYPDERPMVFSEAQMESMGLTEYDLNLVELKCVNTNKLTCDKWTYLVNYINMSNMTKDIMFEQMALEATMIFDKEFSPTGLTNGRYKMYPTTIDLRSLSFDSVMKMLVMNSTKDASYIYGDTMKGLLTNSDIITAILLFLTTLINATLIPFGRDIFMAVIFVIGLWAVIKVVLSDARTQFNTSCGWIISNAVFLVMTLIYFCAFDILAYVATSDEVISSNSIQAEAGSPLWVILITIVFGSLYGFGMVKLFIFITKNWRDMGMEAYATIARQAASKISDGFGKASKAISGAADGAFWGAAGFFGGEKVESGRGKKKVTKGKNGKGIEPSETTGGSSGGSSGVGSDGVSESRGETSKDHGAEAREYSSYQEAHDEQERTDDIDKAIERGKKAEEKQSKESAPKAEEKEKKNSYPADSMMKL